MVKELIIYQMNKQVALLFDWDGTIVDSNAWKWGGAWDEVFKDEPSLRALMKRVLLDDIDKLLNREQLITELFRRASLSGIVPKMSAEVYVKHFGHIVREGTIRKGPFLKAEETLNTLFSLGYRMYAVSATEQHDLEYTAEMLGLSKYFVSLCGAPPTKEVHAEHIRKREVSGTQFIVIGDGENDRHLASNFNCPFVGIMNEWNKWQDETTLRYRIHNISELPAIMGSILSHE